MHIASYGEGNERRLTGKHETSSMHDFRCAPYRSLEAIRLVFSCAECGFPFC